MNVTRENTDALNATVRIDVVKADYEEKVDKKLREYRRTASIKGFRPGHVPFQLIRKMYGTTVLIDEINSLVSEKLSEYIKIENLDILGDPIPLEDGHSFDPEKSDEFSFTFELGLAPEFGLNLSKKQKLTRYQIEPDSKMVADYIDNYARRNGEFIVAEESAEKDVLKGDVISEDGSVINEEASISVEMIKDEKIRNEFLGRSAGETVGFDLRKAFPNDNEIAGLLKKEKNEVKELSGLYSMTIREVSRFTPAENNQELWDKVYGEGNVSSPEEFEARVTEEIKGFFNRESEYKLHTDARDLALDKTEFDLPEEFLKRWLLRVNEKATAEDIEKDWDHFRKDLRWQLVKNRIAKDNEVKITDDEILEEAKSFTRQQFSQYGLYYATDEQITSFARDMLKKEEDARRIAEKVLDTKVLNIIIDSVKVDDKKVSPDEFNKLFAEK
ncbi:MAG: trigger factor [Bacteroidales bacterium]|jgi:trigger factor|nr:trigger factor [Bacteroidales bacterium]MCB9027850.1 trigger factor [Bacteroidales bacterium]MDD3735750.1 trigger factor [Bacteroidales bacterium]NLD63448.1 trigger factor [Bacteroidales bacterium]HNT92820.1 trigger factor [Bacteroidales bacterium]